jgi:hypothetical protein
MREGRRDQDYALWLELSRRWMDARRRWERAAAERSELQAELNELARQMDDLSAAMGYGQDHPLHDPGRQAGNERDYVS